MMKKVELLAPAGSFEALKAAVQNGADAVYLGGSMFGARAFANNFDQNEMKEAIAYAHVYGVQVYVTMNTLLKEEEVKEAIAYADYLYRIDVDAIIVQDMGLFTLLRQMYPDLELHCSTQMHIHNEDGIRLMKQLGAKRVVVPREASLKEIKTYAKLGIDLEVFVQGALCVSYSGQCLMSSKLFDRSGNRGACAQPCRMQYQLYKETKGTIKKVDAKGDYLLSPKDLNTLAYVPELIEAGIASFKIEGRMKRPEYVALMVKQYRQAIDHYYANQKYDVNETILEDMQKIFHRGFTSGHLFHQKGSNLMNPFRPNHMGIVIGKVVAVEAQKVKIKLEKDLYQGDGIRILNRKEDDGFMVNRIYSQNGLLTNKGCANEIIALDRKGYMEKGSLVVKTSDVKQMELLAETYAGNKRKVAVNAMMELVVSKPAKLTIQDHEGNSVSVSSEEKVEKALHRPMEKERILKQMAKTKDTPFTIQTCDIVMEDCVIAVSQINAMRRLALQKLEEKRKVRHTRGKAMPLSLKPCKMKPIAPLHVIVHTYEQAIAAKEAGIEVIYVCEASLKEQLRKEGIEVFLKTDRVYKQAYAKETMFVSENGAVMQGQEYFYDASLNITNSYAAAYFFEHGALGICPSLELDKKELQDMLVAYKKRYQEEMNVIVPIYIQEELMISEYCVINACEKDNDKKGCKLCKGTDNYYLYDKKQRKFPVKGDSACRMHIYAMQPRNEIANIKEYQEMGVQHFLCVLTFETKEESLEILKEMKRKVEQ